MQVNRFAAVAALCAALSPAMASADEAATRAGWDIGVNEAFEHSAEPGA